MGVLRFWIPQQLPIELRSGINQSFRAGDYDHSPLPTRIEVQEDQLLLYWQRDESSLTHIPWKIPGVGQILNRTATLIESPSNYRLTIEMTRGKLNQVRNQLADWESNGLIVWQQIRDILHQATHYLGQGILESPSPSPSPEIVARDASASNSLEESAPEKLDKESIRRQGDKADQLALEGLRLVHAAADELVESYVKQVFELRHKEQARIPSVIGCRLHETPQGNLESAYLRSFNSVCVPMIWSQIEPKETTYQWAAIDSVLNWAEKNHLDISAGPLIDLSPFGLPDWLHPWRHDGLTVASFMCDFVETIVSRYRQRISRWHLCRGLNLGLGLNLGEDERIRLTGRLIEAAWSIDPDLNLVIGISQPWGEYLVNEEHTYSPFVYADTLIRAGIDLAALELEFTMGIASRGSYCRDTLESSQLIDTFGLLGLPIQISMAMPSSNNRDDLAAPGATIGSFGYFRDGFNWAAQASWIRSMAAMALSKDHVTGVIWEHFADSYPHQFPNCGLVDAQGQILPGLDELSELRRAHFV